MDTLKNHFLFAIKRVGKQCTVNLDTNNIVTGIFKEIDNKNSIDTKYFMTMDTLQQGDILTYNNVNYIINTKNNNINDVYNIYEIEKSHMAFNLAVNNVLYNQIGIQYITSLGFLSDQIVTVEGKCSLKVQSNSITNQIALNTRFIKNGQPWKITGINKSNEGLILFTSDIDQISSEDDLISEIPLGTHFPVTTVTVTPSTININVNDTQQLSTTVDVEGVPVTNTTIIYNSDNESIATVDGNGLVTAIGEGNCNIIASYTDSDNKTTTKTVPTTISVPNVVEVRFATSYGTLNSSGHLKIYEGDAPATITVYKYLNNVQQADKFNIVGSNPPSPSSNYHLVGTSNVNSFTVEDLYHTGTLLTITATSTIDGTVGHYYIELVGAF